MAPHPVAEGREPLTQEMILAHAIAIVDAEGLGALSMRRLAREFDVEAMALYYHFPNKQAILDGIVNTVVAEAAGGQPLEVFDDWRQTMRTGILLVRRAMLAHPNVVPLVTSPAAESPAAAVWVEGPLSILRHAGLRGGDLVAAYHQLVSYVFGWHLLAGEGPSGAWSGATGEAAQSEAGSVTRELSESLGDWAEGFEEGLDVLLDGIDVKVRAAASGG